MLFLCPLSKGTLVCSQTLIQVNVAAQVRSRMATIYGRLNGSFHRVLACSAGGPGFDSRLRRNILRCSMQRMYSRWFWSSLYIVVTLTWCAILTQRHAFGRISMRTLHASESHSATIPHRDLGGSCSSTSECSNGSFHRVHACSAGGPGFNSPLRRNILRCSMQRM